MLNSMERAQVPRNPVLFDSATIMQDALRRRAPVHSRTSPRGAVFGMLLGVVVWGGIRPGLPNPDQVPAPASGPVVAAPSGSSGRSIPLEERVLGEWRDNYRGERTLVLRGDGTATMVVKLAGFARKLFAEKLSFDIEWFIEDGQISLKTVSGRPESKFEMIRKLYGDQATYAILAVESNRMHLLDGDGKTEYDWRRPEAMYEEVASDDR